MVKGYYFSERDQKYIVRMMINGKRKILGSFETSEEALECYINNKLKQE